MLIPAMICFCSNIFAQHPNILISTALLPNEPAIMLDPKNTNRMVAGSNIANVYYSSDAGMSWNHIVQSSTFGVWGDPVFAVDTSGNFYHFHLSNPPAGNWIDRIVCQKSTDGGLNWNNGSFAGLNGTKAQDKQWVSIDRQNNHIYMTWTEFDAYGSANPANRSRILFSKSTDEGASWSAAITLSDQTGDCIDSDQTTEGAVPTVGPNGEVYVAWAYNDTIWFERSLDGGTTWLPNDIFVATQPSGWDYSIPGIMRSNGLPVTVCDTASSSPYRGTIYVNWTDARNGLNDVDVWLCKSTDGGNSWSTPVRVNDDPAGKHQFFTWMAVDQKNGNLWFVFYDRRNHSDENTDVYMAFSDDGGATFSNFMVSESPFDPDPAVFFGDYTNIVAYDNVVRPIWTRLDSVLKVYTALVNTGTGFPGYGNSNWSDEITSFPNPFTEETFISFKLKKPSRVTLQIFDMQGKLVANLMDRKELPEGKYIEQFSSKTYGISSGLYYYRLQTDERQIARSIICVR